MSLNRSFIQSRFDQIDPSYYPGQAKEALEAAGLFRPQQARWKGDQRAGKMLNLPTHYTYRGGHNTVGRGNPYHGRRDYYTVLEKGPDGKKRYVDKPIDSQNFFTVGLENLPTAIDEGGVGLQANREKTFRPEKKGRLAGASDEELDRIELLNKLAADRRATILDYRSNVLESKGIGQFDSDYFKDLVKDTKAFRTENKDAFQQLRDNQSTLSDLTTQIRGMEKGAEGRQGLIDKRKAAYQLVKDIKSGIKGFDDYREDMGRIRDIKTRRKAAGERADELVDYLDRTRPAMKQLREERQAFNQKYKRGRFNPNNKVAQDRYNKREAFREEQRAKNAKRREEGTYKRGKKLGMFYY